MDHSILLHKLNHYGIRGVVNDWFSSYLSGRVQTTQIGSYISQKEKSLCGVPQGSVLGPLLFLIFINDIYNASDKLAFYLFADDTNLLFADRNLKSLELQSYPGLVNCFNRFSPILAELTAPMRVLGKKDTPFTWESTQQAAFEAIKNEITKATVLAYFDKSKSCIIQSDASQKV